MVTLREIKLPDPDTRLVVFGTTVFKLKYKMRLVPVQGCRAMHTGPKQGQNNDVSILFSPARS